MSLLLAVARLLALLAGVALGALAYRTVARSDRPAAKSFALLLAVLSVTAICASVTAHTGVPYKLVWLYTGLSIPLALAFFTADYYGVDLLATPTRAGTAVAPALVGATGGTAVVLGSPSMSPGEAAPLVALPAEVVVVATALNNIGIYYTTAVMLLAIGLVFWTVSRYAHLEARLAIVLSFVGAWPWAANLFVPQFAAVAGQGAGIAAVAGGYALSASLAGLALGPMAMLESSPMAATVGTRTVLDSLDDAVVVVDAGERVLRMNDRACELFGTDEHAAIGAPFAAVVGEPVAALTREEPATIETSVGRRTVAGTVSPVVDRNGNDRGSAVVLRDVTDRRTREQRLEVFNRVLRHNLRSDATHILGRAERIGDGADPEASAAAIRDATRDLVRTAERARDIERMLAAEPSGPVAVRPIVESVVAEVTETYPDVEVTIALPEDATAAVSEVALEVVVRNLLENAAAHNDADEPIATVSGSYDEDGGLSIAVTDNGPGIPDHERSVLSAGEEDALEHGSGLGLWAVRWGVTSMGGALSFTDNDPRGTTVVVTVPTAEATEPPAAEPPAESSA